MKKLCNKLKCILFILLIVHSYNGKAQETQPEEVQKPIVEYVNGSKHIYLEQLYFSPNMTVWEFLQLFPELVSRGAQDVLNNYAIVMEDYSLGTNRDAILYQMTLGEIKEIVISDNPSVAYTKNGVGGVIELVPKDLTAELSGNAQLDVATESSVLASASINYKKNKLLIRSFIKGEYLNCWDKYNMHYYGSTRYNDFEYTDETLAGTELAKFSLEYSASEKDNLTFALWETYGAKVFKEVEKNNILQTAEHYSTSHSSGIGTLSRLLYSHQFNPYHKLKFSANYSFNQTLQSNSDEDTTYSQPHEVEATLRYTGSVIHREKHDLTMVTGLDFFNQLARHEKPFVPSYSNTDISPMLELRYTMQDKLFVRVGSRYHYNLYHFYSQGTRDTNEHNYMASAEIDYTPTMGHTLRASILRDRICAGNGQNNGHLEAADISYIFQKSKGIHYINATAGWQYNRVSLSNGHLYNVFAIKAGITWQYRWLCLSLTSHIFENASNRNEIKDYHLYYNLRLTPIFTLPKDWHISANLMYNSPMMSKTISEGGYFYTSFRVSKKIGKWSINTELADPFHYQTSDEHYLSEEYMLESILYSKKSYFPYHRYLDIGVMYEF